MFLQTKNRFRVKDAMALAIRAVKLKEDNDPKSITAESVKREIETGVSGPNTRGYRR